LEGFKQRDDTIDGEDGLQRADFSLGMSMGSSFLWSNFPASNWNPLEEVIFTTPYQPFLVTFNHGTRTHTMWILRQSKAVMGQRLASPGRRTVLRLKNPKKTTDSNYTRDDTEGPDPVQRFLKRQIFPQGVTGKLTRKGQPAELYLEQSWRSEPGGVACGGPAHRIFLASTLEGNPLICFVSKLAQELKVYRISSTDENSTFAGSCGVGMANVLSGSVGIQLEHLMSLRVLDAVPIRSPRNRLSEDEV